MALMVFGMGPFDGILALICGCARTRPKKTLSLYQKLGARGARGIGAEERLGNVNLTPHKGVKPARCGPARGSTRSMSSFIAQRLRGALYKMVLPLNNCVNYSYSRLTWVEPKLMLC